MGESTALARDKNAYQDGLEYENMTCKRGISWYIHVYPIARNGG